jgi:hypothetical protein
VREGISNPCDGCRGVFIVRKTYPHSINPKDYRLDSTKRNYSQAKNRKTKLKRQGYRVKIRKNIDGLFEVHKKDITLIAYQRDQGNGRVRA